MSTYKLLYNGVAQITSALYRNAADSATIIGYEHGYDKMGNPNYEVRVHQSSYGDEYTYDNLYRVTRTVYDDSTPTTPTASPAATSADDWLLDDIGNRTKIYAKSASATEYEHNAVNEYTSVGGTGYEYDAAGNLTRDDTHYYFWDYQNRLTKVELVSDSSDVAAYTYDANNRRVERLDYTADPDETTQYFYNGWSCIEEREDDGALLATYVNGPRIDEYILMNRDSTDYWYMQSPIVGNVAALVNSSGEIQEGYKYRAYGKATVLTGAGNDTTWFTSDDDTATTSAIGHPYTFTGRRLDDETMLMYFRNRMYCPDLGIFISHDPMEYADEMSLYQYAAFLPMLMTDRTGRVSEKGFTQFTADLVTCSGGKWDVKFKTGGLSLIVGGGGGKAQCTCQTSVYWAKRTYTNSEEEKCSEKLMRSAQCDVKVNSLSLGLDLSLGKQVSSGTVFDAPSALQLTKKLDGLSTEASFSLVVATGNVGEAASGDVSSHGSAWGASWFGAGGKFSYCWAKLIICGYGNEKIKDSCASTLKVWEKTGSKGVSDELTRLYDPKEQADPE